MDQSLRSYLIPVITALAVFLIGNLALYIALFGLPETPPESLEIPPVSAGAVTQGQMVDSPTQPAFEPAPGAIWDTNEGVTRQLADLGQDMVRGTGLIAERFDVQLSVGLPPDVAEAGGGLVFHMPSRDDYAGAGMVRLANGGSEVYWGYFDERYAFQGEGSATIDDITTPMTLSIQVRAETYSILVNGALIAAEVPLGSAGGYLGFISFRGPVSFSDLILSPSS
jgi:hypothetical protein